MVAERKELERNVLAQQLGRAYQGIRQGPSRGTVIFLGVIVAAVLIYFVYRYFSQSSADASSHRWLKLDTALFPQQLGDLLEEGDFKDSAQYRLAQLRMARADLARGLRDLGHVNPRVRNDARERIEKAAKLYDELAKSPGRVPLLHQEALWGAAKAYEALGGADNIDAARERYEKLRSEYPTSALGKDAKKQLDRLGSDATRQELREINRELTPPASR